jgi:DNA primase
MVQASSASPMNRQCLCQFHYDHNPSFGVNDAEYCWHCFAGCGGGSVIDF